jgi:hypothetical protein
VLIWERRVLLCAAPSNASFCEYPRCGWSTCHWRPAA